MALTEYFARFLRRRNDLGDADLAKLRSVPVTLRSFDGGETILSAGRRTQSALMLRGIGGSVHRVPGRNAQQAITALHVPGDFVDLHRFVMAGTQHEVVSFGPSEAEFIDHADLADLTASYPQLTCLLWTSTAIDTAIHRQWLVAANALRSSAHLAHLLCEIYTRLSAVGSTGGTAGGTAAGSGGTRRFVLPLLQRQLADLLGYSPIHVNRAVRDLRDRGLVRWTGTEIEILDWPGLAALGRFDPAYLELERRSR